MTRVAPVSGARENFVYGIFYRVVMKIVLKNVRLIG